MNPGHLYNLGSTDEIRDHLREFGFMYPVDYLKSELEFAQNQPETKTLCKLIETQITRNTKFKAQQAS